METHLIEDFAKSWRDAPTRLPERLRAGASYDGNDEVRP
jgi:hypothetical protein